MTPQLKKSIISREKREAKTLADGSAMLINARDHLSSGLDVFGLTMGKFSLVQLVEMVVRNFGGNFNMSTCIWSANQVDIHRLSYFRNDKLLSDCRFLVDPSAYTRKKEAIEQLYMEFGIDAVRCVNTHAKFVTLRNDVHNFAIVSSMNFTHNPRLEQFSITDCANTCDLLESVVNEAFEIYRPEDNFTGQAASRFIDIAKKIEERDNKKDDDFHDIDGDFLDIFD